MKRKAKVMKHQDKPALPREDASEDFKAGTTERPNVLEEHHGVPPEAFGATEKRLSPKDETTKQIEGYKRWIAEHQDDKVGVQQREQDIVSLQHRLIDIEVYERDRAHS